jgi:hypothetical protein
MKTIKLTLLLLVLISSFGLINAADHVFFYSIELEYNQGNINILNTGINFSQIGLENIPGTEGESYFFELFNIHGNVLHKEYFFVPNIEIYDELDEQGNSIGGESIILDQVTFELYAPYFENTKDIVIYNEQGEELARTDISEYSKERRSEQGEIITIGLEAEERTSPLLLITLIITLLIIIIIAAIIIILKRNKHKKHKRYHKHH